MAKKPVWVLPDGSTVGQKDLGKVKPTPKATVKATVKPKVIPKPKATPTLKKTLPTMAQYKQSAASKTMSYKAYLDSFKARGYK